MQQIPHDTIEQLDSNDIFRTLHPKKTQKTYSSAHGTFSRINHILGQKTSLNKFKIIEIISSIFSNNDMKRKINHRKRNEIVITRRLIIYVIKISVVSDEIKEEM